MGLSFVCLFYQEKVSNPSFWGRAVKNTLKKSMFIVPFAWVSGCMWQGCKLEGQLQWNPFTLIVWILLQQCWLRRFSLPIRFEIEEWLWWIRLFLWISLRLNKHNPATHGTILFSLISVTKPERHGASPQATVTLVTLRSLAGVLLGQPELLLHLCSSRRVLSVESVNPLSHADMPGSLLEEQAEENTSTLSNMCWAL